MKAINEGNGSSGKLGWASTRAMLAAVIFASACLGGMMPVHAQQTATAIRAGTFSLTSRNVAALEFLSDAQLASVLKSLAATPTISPSSLPYGGMGGNYYSLAHPSWPPMPGDVRSIPVWSLGQNSASGSYLLDDIDYPETPGTNSGVQGMDAGFRPQTLTTNDLYLRIVSVANGAANLVIHPPWNLTNDTFDLLYCTNLLPPISWQWLLRSNPGQTNLVVPNATDAQGFYRLSPPNDLVANDSLGTNFWFMFFKMFYGGGNGNLSLYISSPVGATGTVTIPCLGITNSFTLAAGAVTNISISPNAMMVDYDVVETNSIHIAASQPVSVYAMDYNDYASAAFTCYPTPLLGTNYCLMARASMVDAYFGNGNSQLAIAATVDNTTVIITPSATANLEGHPIQYTNILQQGETYQIESIDNMADDITNDVTGTLVTSDKPIGVFAGANLAWIPSTNYGTGNPLVQEQMPVDSWGTQALAVSFAGRSYGDAYRILAANSNTVVTITTTNRIIVVTNQAGQFYETNLDGPVEFQSSQPIQVAQFANGSAFDNATNAQGYLHEGDPCEILLPSTGHYLETNTVFTLPNDSITGDFDENYINIIVAQSAITNTLVDGAHVATTNFMAIGTSGYYGAQIVVTSNGVHTVTSSQPVGVEIYGWGTADTYGYFGGIVK